MHKVAQDLEHWFAADLLPKEQITVTFFDDIFKFILRYEKTPKQIFTLVLLLDLTTLQEIRPAQRYCIVAFMRVMLYDIRMKSKPGIFTIGWQQYDTSAGK